MRSFVPLISMKFRILLPLSAVFLLILSACAQVTRPDVGSDVSDSEEQQEMKGENPADKEDDGMEKTTKEVEKNMDDDEKEEAMKEADKAEQGVDEEEGDLHEAADADAAVEDAGGNGQEAQ